MTKWLLLSGAFVSGQWWWAVVIPIGGLLAGGYMFRALKPVMAEGSCPAASVSRVRELAVLSLAVFALLLGMFPEKPIEIMSIGRPDFAEVRR